MAGCVVFYIFLAYFYVKYSDYTVLSVLVCIRALLAQRALESRGQFACDFKLHFDVPKIGQSLDKSSVRYCILYNIYSIWSKNITWIDYFGTECVLNISKSYN